MTRHNDQQHAQRHHDDVAVLQNQIGQVKRLEQGSFGHDLKEHHDDHKCHQQSVFTQVVFQEGRAASGRRGCACVGGCHVNSLLMSR
jgi:hypothetical protein